MVNFFFFIKKIKILPPKYFFHFNFLNLNKNFHYKNTLFLSPLNGPAKDSICIVFFDKDKLS